MSVNDSGAGGTRMKRDFGGRMWEIECARGGALLILLSGGGIPSDFIEKYNASGAPPVTVAAPLDVDWDRDYSPWAAECIGRSFGGGADALGESAAILRGEAVQNGVSKSYIIGYSLGGLAALYLHTKLGFDGCGSCSGSLWFPRWREYIDAADVRGRVYLSLGGKEKNSPDALMATVADATEFTRRACESKADRVCFRCEPGGHFRDPDGRLARAAAWLCG